MNDAIGGYFGLELPSNKEFHNKAIALNSGRNCLRYILENRDYVKIYLPLYICDSVVRIVEAKDINYSFYSLNNNFLPEKGVVLQKGEVFYYVNYFGLFDNNVKNVLKSFSNVIVDNSQAFFSRPEKVADTYYSPRKYFGVSDGGYLYGNFNNTTELETEHSYANFKHLLIRHDISPEAGYKYYLKNENAINKKPIKYMSKLTKRIMLSIDYENVSEKRVYNYQQYEISLGNMNEFTTKVNISSGPLVYPFLFKNEKLRQYLIENKIYIPAYWQEVIPRVDENSFENRLVMHLCPLPIDQRYSSKDIKYVIGKIKEFIKNY